MQRKVPGESGPNFQCVVRNVDTTRVKECCHRTTTHHTSTHKIDDIGLLHICSGDSLQPSTIHDVRMLLYNTLVAAVIQAMLLLQPGAALNARATGHQHGAAGQHHKRQTATTPLAGVSTVMVVPVALSFSATATVSSNITTYTLLTPSPSAAAVAITQQSQVITTFVPQMTLCAMGLIPVTHYNNASRTAPYMNYSTSVSYSLSEGCTTMYTPSRTTVCATTLRGLATAVAVTACDQPVTFSSQFGYTQDAPASGASAAAPSITTQTTFFVAPWQALATGAMPVNVTERICSMRSATRRCVDVRQSWSTTVVMVVTATTSHVDLTTTIPGPSRLIIETFHADITETMTDFSISTVMVLQVSTESTSTMVSTILGGPTVTTTYTLDRVT